MKHSNTQQSSASPFALLIPCIMPAFALCALMWNTATAAPPVVQASTYLGGSGFEITWACATDADGNVYIAGDAQAADLPVTAEALQRIYGDGGQDGFVAKYD